MIIIMISPRKVEVHYDYDYRFIV